MRKKKTSSAYIVIIIILLAVIIYLISSKNNSVELDQPKSNQSTIKNNSPKKLLYEAGSPEYIELISVLKKAYGQDSDENIDRPINVFQQKDITGDSVLDLLVDMGTGGAASDNYSVVRIEGGKPYVVQIKEEDGKVDFISGSNGGGGGGRYGSNLELLSNQKSILLSSYFVYGESTDNCASSIYTWNPKTKLFEFNKVESDKRTKELLKMCYKIASDTGVKYQNK